MDYTVLGMPLNLVDEKGVTISPLSALVVIKAIDNEGDIVYTLANTEGVTPVEGLGMINFGKLYLEHLVKYSVAASE